LILVFVQESLEAYNQKNYPDWFASVGKVMIRRPDGTFFLATEREVDELKKANKLTVQIPKAMGGRMTDVTQRPVLMLKE
jgi:hypothetical protein